MSRDIPSPPCGPRFASPVMRWRSRLRPSSRSTGQLSGRPSVLPWIGGLPSLIIHGLVLGACLLGWRIPVAPCELSLGRTPLGFSLPIPMQAASDAPPAEPARLDGSIPDDSALPVPLIEAVDLPDDPALDDPAPCTPVIEPLDAGPILAAVILHPRRVTRDAADPDATPPRRAMARPAADSTPASPAASASTSPSRILKRVDPAYPRTALRLGRQGTVYVRMAVAEDGRVITAVAERSSGRADMDQAALAAVRQWLFDAATPEDPHPRIVTIDIRFVLGS